MSTPNDEFDGVRHGSLEKRKDRRMLSSLSPSSSPQASSDLPFAPSPIPRHIAIIMDGNGRWAEARGKSRIEGHRAGAESVRRTVRACGQWGIEYLTLYAFSTENWTRPRAEVQALMMLLEDYLQKEVEELDKNDVRLRAIGDLERLAPSIRRTLVQAIEQLEDNKGLTLVLALSYGGRDEIVRAVRCLTEKVREGILAPSAITEETLASSLDTVGMPDPDLLIRTAGEMRLSNFLLWQLSYAEFYTTPICWPDFDESALAEAIRAFQRRTRKFGQVL